MSILGYWLAGLPGGTAAVAAAAGVAALTALYLLKLHRRRIVVPFAPLWAPAAGERQSERLARRLRRLVSLLLQILFLGLVLLAAADPRPATAGRQGRSVLILVDRSASMSATDEPEGRLAAARRAARDLIGGLGSSDRAMVASFAASAAAETGFETDERTLGAAIDRLRPTEEPGDIARAIEFAAAALRGRPRPTLVVIGDGAYPEDARRRLPDGLLGADLRFVPVGRRAENLAITSFAARRLPADRTSVEVGITIESFQDAPSEAVLEVSAGDTLVDRVALSLPPRARIHRLLPDVAAPDARLEARLLPKDGAGPLDDLAVDDRAYAVVPGLPHRRVLRIGDGDLYLDGALLSLGETVSVRRVSASAVESTRAEWPRFDAVIFDGLSPVPPPAAGRFLYLAPRGPGSPWTERGPVREPVVSDAKRQHPLLRHLSLADLNVREARRLTPGPGDDVVVAAFGAPLLLARRGPAIRIVALAFDPRRSDLPLRSAFPLFVSNALDWLVGADTTEARSARTGRSFPTTGFVAGPADPGAAPDGAAGSSVVAVNLGDVVESDTRPHTTLVLGGRALPPPDRGPGGPRREVWVLALAAAAGLSIFEWWSYHRRWTV